VDRPTHVQQIQPCSRLAGRYQRTNGNLNQPDCAGHWVSHNRPNSVDWAGLRSQPEPVQPNFPGAFLAAGWTVRPLAYPAGSFSPSKAPGPSHPRGNKSPRHACEAGCAGSTEIQRDFSAHPTRGGINPPASFAKPASPAQPDSQGLSSRRSRLCTLEGGFSRPRPSTRYPTTAFAV